MFSTIKITSEDLDTLDLEGLIKDAHEKTCENYSRKFYLEANVAAERGDEKTKNILLLFHGFTSLMLQPKEKHHPFSPSRIMADGSRSTIISDFTDEQIELFKIWLPSCKDSELQSRVADVIWTRKHQGNYVFAELVGSLARVRP